MAEPAVVFPLNAIPSATTLMLQNGMVWAFLRVGKVLHNRWGTPGGKVELDDRGVPQRPVVAAAEELKQEAGVEVADLSRLVHIGTVPEFSDKGLFVCNIHVLRLRHEESPANLEPDKHRDFQMHTVDELLAKGEQLLPSLRFGLEYLRAHPELFES